MNYDNVWMNVLAAILLFLPAGIANMSPVLANKIPGLKRWKTPLDFGKSIRGRRILGNNKTWRGVVTGTTMAIFTGLLGLALSSHFSFTLSSVLIVSAASGLMGCGALMGDALESFFKRQRGIRSGESWFPFDQLDYILGGLVFSFPLIRWPLEAMFYIIVVYFGLHLIFSYIGYKVGLKDKPI